jgi:hypothetical protein
MAKQLASVSLNTLATEGSTKLLRNNIALSGAPCNIIVQQIAQ